MAFPNTPVLDSFNAGASQALTARTGWDSTIMRPGLLTLTTDSVPTKAVSTVAGKSNVWNDPKVRDSETWCTLADWTAGTHQLYLSTRVTNQTSAWELYCLQIGPAANYFQLIRFKAGGGAGTAALGSNQLVTCATGDSIGIRVVGTTIEAHRKPAAGAWALVYSVVDTAAAAFTTPGKYGGVFLYGGNIDEMGGGAIPQELAISGVGR